MADLSRLKNRLLAKVLTRFPSLARRFLNSCAPEESKGIPWTPVTKPLGDCTVAVVTTAGVHHRDQVPFNMIDTNGDPTFRAINVARPLSELMITHDYYDHTEADRDMNIVFPIERLREFEKEGIIRKVAATHYGFMGHILGPHLETLINETAPEVAGLIKAEGVDVVLLTPG